MSCKGTLSIDRNRDRSESKRGLHFATFHIPSKSPTRHTLTVRENHSIGWKNVVDWEQVVVVISLHALEKNE